MTSAKLEYDVPIEGAYTTSMLFLALSSDSQSLLVSHHKDRKFHIYSVRGHRLSTIYVNEQLLIMGAAWTHSDRVVYAAKTPNNGKKIIIGVASSHNKQHTIIKTHTITGIFHNIEAAANNSVLFLCVENVKSATIYQSTNESSTWSAVISSPEGCRWRYVTCTSHNHYGTHTEFWAVELDANEARPSILVYTIEMSGSKQDHFNVILPESFNSQLLLRSTITYDGKSSVLMTDINGSEVYVWSVRDRKFDRVLLLTSSQQLNNIGGIYSLAVSRGLRSQEKLYVIQSATVRVFTLTYEYR